MPDLNEIDEEEPEQASQEGSDVPERGESEEDWDFPFEEEYGDDLEAQQDIVNPDHKPRDSYLRSKFASFQRYADRIEDLSDQASLHAISVEGGSKDIAVYQKLFGILNEIYDHIEYLHGTRATERVDRLRDHTEYLLRKYGQRGELPDVVRIYLIKYKRKVYRLKWQSNLALTVEKIRRGSSRTQQRITS